MTQRIALITGGLGGIGTAMAIRLGKAGHTVVALDVSAEHADSWLAQLKPLGIQAHAYAGDVASFDAMATVLAKIMAEVGPIDVLVNNAGITKDGMFKRMGFDDWAAVLRINLDSVFNVTKPVIGGMAERGWGRVINISSVNGQKGQAGQTNYSAAKAGMHGFTKALAQEYASKGITVNSISPGYVATAMVKKIKPEILESLIKQVPAGRLAEPEEIGALVAYLASDDAAYITGANIAINGGMHMF